MFLFKLYSDFFYSDGKFIHFCLALLNCFPHFSIGKHLSNKINQLERCETPNYTSVKVFDVQVPLYPEQVVKYFENRFQNLSYPSHKT